MAKAKTISNPLKTVLGPLWKTLQEPGLEFLCVDSYEEVYFFEKGKSHDVPRAFKNNDEVMQVISRMAKHAGKTLTNETTHLYIELDQHTRVNIVLPPLAVKGPSLSIVKIPDQKFNLQDMVRFGTMKSSDAEIIQSAIADGKGILVAGNPGSGKTTLLNSIIESIPHEWRIVTIERFADLMVSRPKVCRLKTENQKPEEMVELVHLANKMFGDYVVLSECSGPEVMPFLDLVRNNFSGIGLITAENALDALKQLETKAVLSSNGFSLEDARHAISQAMKLVVFQEKRPDGKRVVSTIGEISFDQGELKLKVLSKN